MAEIIKLSSIGLLARYIDLIFIRFYSTILTPFSLSLSLSPSFWFLLQAMDSATLPPSCDMFGLKQMGTQKISVVSDQTNGFHHNDKKPDSFVLDIERFSRVTDRDTTPNSRITLQRNLSRKWSQRGGGEKKPNFNAIANEKDTSVATSSPRAALAGAGTPESPVAVVVGTTDNLSSHPQAHHQITITAGNISSIVESKCGFRRNSFRRYPTYWTIDPRKILYFFATLSSMGTLVLICFTLSMSKLNEGDSDALSWPQ